MVDNHMRHTHLSVCVLSRFARTAGARQHAGRRLAPPTPQASNNMHLIALPLPGLYFDTSITSSIAGGAREIER